MSDPNSAGTRLRPRRIEIRLRNNGTLEASIPLQDGQALAPYLASRRGSVNLADVVWTETGKRVEQLTLSDNEIVWARPLDTAIPLTNVMPLERGGLVMEVVLAGGQVLRGTLPLLPGQPISDFLGTAGAFPVLWSAKLPDEQVLGDVAVNQGALRSVREVGGTNGHGFWERTTPAPGWGRTTPAAAAASASSSPGADVHWLIRVARSAGLTGAEALSAPPSSPVAGVWSAVCSAANVDDDELAAAVARTLKLGVAPRSSIGEGDALIPAPLAERYGVRGIADDGRTLTVATADPLNADAEQALGFACKRRIIFAVAAPRVLGHGQTQNAEAELESLLAEMPSAAGDGVRIEEDVDTRAVETDDVSAEPIIRLANLVLREAVRQGASDIHLEPDQARGLIRFRVDGVLRPFMHVPLPALHKVISRYKIVSRLDIADRIRPQDGRVRIRVDGQPYELRLSTVPTQDAEKAVIRIAGSVQDQTLDQLEIPAHELERLRQLLAFRDGIIIVTGPTGSGKTTTLYGALHELNTGRTNIMTVEDPVERALPGLTQIQVQPKRGVTFASALRAILRQDPDIILVGEIRDLETAEIAVQAATTGHLVLTTLHTTSAVGVVERLRDLGLDRTSLAASLRGVVAQRLARRVCASCAGEGCDDCGRSGYRGRVPLMEVLTATPDFAQLIGRGALYHELQEAALETGMRPIREVADERVRDGVTTAAEVQRVLGDAEQEQVRLHGSMNGRGRPALPAAMVEIIDVEPAGLLAEPVSPNGGGTNLPARREETPQAYEPAAHRRAEFARALLQGLDRCVAEGQSMKDVLHFACEQLAAAYEAPLVWIATLDGATLNMRARAGSSAPYVRDIVPEWQDLETSDGAVATALRTGSPQGRHLAEEPGFDSWREYARMHGLPIFLAVPLAGDSGPVGVVGLHARGMNGLDQQAGQDLMSLVDRIAGVIQRLRQMEAAGLQVAALESAADAVFTTDRDGVIQWVNRSFTALSGYTAEDAVGSTPRILRSERQDPAYYRELWETILAGRSWRGELYNLRRDGTVYAVEQTVTPITDEHGRVTHFLAVQRDITDRKRREEHTRQLITTDPLTNLPNTRALHAELGRVITAAADGGAEGALLLISIDGGTALRDSAGPVIADRLVTAVAPVLAQTLRPGDLLARIGEDEFAALLPRTSQNGACIAADRLRDAVARHAFDLPGAAASPSVSIGVSVVDGTLGVRAVLATADAALYGSRERRDGVIVLHTGAAEAAQDSGDEEWARRIRQALHDDQFFLHFQPVIRLSTGMISHYDALLRLYDEDGDIIPARAFISHAENLGLMPQIDRWVVENVLRMLHTSPELSVSLNLSTSTVLNPAFRQFMQRQSRRMNAVGTRIIFEVAEAGAAQDLPRMLDNMKRLRDLGCRFALDNFGIGPNSLASLGTLPVDYVKLDGSLIRGVDLDENRYEIVAALATVARALGKEVVAGWAERETIVQLLPDLGIEFAQGHYLGAPAPDLRRSGDTGEEEEELTWQARVAI